jgi:acyl transferase domain-containing protein
LAGGVTVLANPWIFVGMSRQRAMSPDGRCRAFAAGADGTGFSDGLGLVVLERLSDAQRLGHRVLAVVRGSAVNQDGASNGLTAPNGPSQERVIRRALADAGLAPDEVDVVEAHGTGTTLGDPIEAQALIATYGQARERAPLWLGSLKSNIGHSQAAAGVGGVIKMVKAFEHELLPPTLHVDVPTPQVDWSAGAVELLVEPREWPVGERPRRAGVSSFGISGTNAHVILEEPPPSPAGVASERTSAAGVVGEGAPPWVLSARSAGALRAQAARLAERVRTDRELDAGDVALTLAGRAVLTHRAVLVGDGRESLVGGLEAVAAGESGAGVVEGVAGGVREAVFLFPGQGSQWRGMALELLAVAPVFAERMRLCGEALAPFVDWSLEGVLRGEDGAPGLERIDVVQPVLFAVVVSLAALWRACGVEPGVVAGHSQGEIAAVHVAGGLSLEDAARLVALRSRLLTKLVGKGGIVSVALGELQVRERLERWGERIVVSAVNGAASTTVAGDLESLQELLAELEGDGVRARLVPATVATHSPQAEPLREELLGAIEGITPRAGEVPFLSTVTGGFLDTAELDGEYWYRNMREPVQLERVTRRLLEDGYRTFIEISPHPVLTFGVQQTIEDALEDPEEALAIGSLRRCRLMRFSVSATGSARGRVGVM